MTGAIIQARMGSSRLWGKILLPLQGRPVLRHVIERVRESKKIEKVIVATTREPSDDKTAAFCKELGVECFRGSENDVLDRYYKAAKRFGFSHIVRVTGDCPMIDPEIIDQVIDLYQKEKEGLDYATNVIPHTFPDGLDVEIFSMETLKKAQRETKLNSDREHVTTYMWGNPNLFKQKHLKSEVDLSNRRWVLDNPEDYEFMQKTFDMLYPLCPKFRLNDLLKFFAENPEIEKLNKDIKRNEGLARSKEQDKLTK